MLAAASPAVWLTALFGIVALLVLLRRPFSAEVRARRRRDRSHGPVVSRKRSPTVKLAANVDEPKRKPRR
jgi:hypothetical protein